MLLFIGLQSTRYHISTKISIHLMLLFILLFLLIGYLLFISIHLMLLFICDRLKFQELYHHFNTSHVTVYHLVHAFRVMFHHISIHLMLLFIRKLEEFHWQKWYFNTSHVTVYLKQGFCIAFNSGFQYISCYCLSESSFLPSFCLCHFNTSHVTVYRVP